MAVSTNTRRHLTDAQTELVTDLDDVAEHVMYEFDPTEYDGIGTVGFAHIRGIDGRSSLVRRCASLVDSDRVDWITRDDCHPGETDQNSESAPLRIAIGGLQVRLAPNHDSGYRCTITNVSEIRPGPEHQRLDVRERLHRLLLDRLQYHGYLRRGVWITRRMD